VTNDLVVSDAAAHQPMRYAVIPTHNRPEHLGRLVGQLAVSCDYIMVVDNASTPAVDPLKLLSFALPHTPALHVIRDEEQPPNLARLWNVALAEIARLEAAKGSTSWDVAILNDDVELPDGWYNHMAQALRTHDVLAVSGDAYGHVREPLLRRDKHNNLMTRMCPWAFVIRGECGVEADEKLRWWWQDTDIEWRLAIAGGVLVLPGFVAKNVGANSSTVGVLAEQAGRDRATFAAKWNFVPW
jgi:hypothetical protein